MSLHTLLPSTPRLDQLVAEVVLVDRSPLPVNGKTVLYRYAWPTELRTEVKNEIVGMVCRKVATYESVVNQDVVV
jgi:hypothetical protein